MKKTKITLCAALGLLLAGALPSGLRAGGDESVGEGASSDPFAYCAAVGTADKPGPRYAGPALPPAVLTGTRHAVGISADAPDDWVARGTSWRCMDGRVYACFVGANLPCQEKANTSRTRSRAIVDFCKARPASDAVPMSTSGHATVYVWRCSDGKPEIVRQFAQPDARGFISTVWHRLAPGS